jgi:hypothetical protein
VYLIDPSEVLKNPKSTGADKPFFQSYNHFTRIFGYCTVAKNSSKMFIALQGRPICTCSFVVFYPSLKSINRTGIKLESSVSFEKIRL